MLQKRVDMPSIQRTSSAYSDIGHSSMKLAIIRIKRHDTVTSSDDRVEARAERDMAEYRWYGEE